MPGVSKGFVGSLALLIPEAKVLGCFATEGCLAERGVGGAARPRQGAKAPKSLAPPPALAGSKNPSFQTGKTRLKLVKDILSFTRKPVRG